MDKISLWKKQIESIKNDTSRMMGNRMFFEAYFNIVKNNKYIQTPTHFHKWITENYFCSILMNIRRQLDTRKGVVSLYKLLSDMLANNSILSRSWYVSTYKYEFADTDFIGLVGNTNFVGKKYIENDLTKLKLLGNKIENFSDEHLAHMSITPKSENVTLKEVNTFVDEFKSILKRCYLLLTAKSYVTFLPTPQADWTSIFKTPWID